MPRNGTNNEERENIENRENLLYNISYVTQSYKKYYTGGFKIYDKSRINAKDERRYGDERIFEVDKREL